MRSAVPPPTACAAAAYAMAEPMRGGVFPVLMLASRLAAMLPTVPLLAARVASLRERNHRHRVEWLVQARADRALCQAKAGGRHRTVVASGGTEPT